MRLQRLRHVTMFTADAREDVGFGRNDPPPP